MRIKRILSVLLLLGVVVALALPNHSVVARKLVYKAQMTTGAELHTVVGSEARGSAVFGSAVDGSFNFTVQVRGLSGPATGLHIHGPADVTQTAPVLIGLCGSPGIAAAGPCVTDADGTLTVSGNINSTVLANWGVSGGTFLSLLRDGLLYVNVHTALNPAGEARGQIYEN